MVPFLTSLLVGPGESSRGSGEDLSTFFYSLTHLPAWVPRNAIGISMLGSEFSEFDLEPSMEYFLGLRVVCLGDTNAVDIAQTCHEAVLHWCGGLALENVLKYGCTVPSSNRVD